MFGARHYPPPPPPPRTPTMQAYDFVEQYMMAAARGGNIITAATAYKMWDEMTDLYIERRKREAASE